jgi:amino acid transporter
MPPASSPAAAPAPVRFGTFQGVFRPVFLTVLGALLYLREGWLVGNAGIGGALFVICAAYLITGTTALSLSSIATNLRVRAGGAFAIISAALGLEAGGAIGVPLFIAQTISSVMYLFAFTEAWGYLFPGHPPALVVGVAFLAVAGIVLWSASVASRAQAVMFVVVLVAVGSAFAGWPGAERVRPVLVGRFEEASLLECFALFFPAATGIMVGVGMSGNLENPRHSIPRGTMAAWGTTFVVYVLGAVWYGTVATRAELLSNNLVMIDRALFGPVVLFGLLSSTLMAALSSLVAAPRLLQAMAAYGVVPRAAWLEQTHRGEPRNATLVTMGLAAVGLTAGSLDAIAPVITSFFVMTYLAVNVVVLAEQSLGLVSWRPTFRVPNAVPAVGAVACVTGLVLSSPAGGLPEVGFVLGLYLWLVRRRQVKTPWETVQSGMAQTLAAWAARKAAQLKRSERSWKPDLLVPVATVDEVVAVAAVAETLIVVQGSVKLVALSDDPALWAALDEAVRDMRSRDRFCSWHRMPEERPGQGARLSMNAMQGTFFPPNLVLLSGRHVDGPVIQEVVDHARRIGMGVVLAFDDPAAPMRPCGAVNVWLSDRTPDWSVALHVANLDLPVLLAYLVTRPRQGVVRLASVVREDWARPAAERFLGDVIELGRLPDTTAHVLGGTLDQRLSDAPAADLHIFGLSNHVDLKRLREIRDRAGAPCLFVQDSGQESALA